jgi:5-amino-6-(5-phosphoribosylamino)uracil reductase
MRPKIICQMVTSIDGRLYPSRWTKTSAVSETRMHDQYDAVYERSKADGWIVGRITMGEMAHGSPPAAANIAGDLRKTHVADRKGRRLAVAIDPHGRVRYGSDTVAGDHVVAILGEQVPDGYLAELRAAGVSYLFAGPDGRDLPTALDTLGGAFGAGTLVLQGGGRTNGTFLKAGLIDEFSILIFPGVDGLAGVPSIVEADGQPGERPAAGQALRLLGSEVLDEGMVWLRYAVERLSCPEKVA